MRNIGAETCVKEGFVYVICGARSRDAQDGNGKAPAPVVDLKAGVRYLRANDAAIPGDCAKIVSVGGSGGGEMSSMLGATGNMEEYYPYLYEIGAAGIEKQGNRYVSTIKDDVFGCMAFFPIADIENADLAYAWLRHDSGEEGIRLFFPIEKRGQLQPFTPFQQELQNDLALAYCEYINGLGLINADGKKLTFNTDPETGKLDPRSGSYYDQILQNLSDALNKHLAQQADADAYMKEHYGDDSGQLPNWLKKNEDGSYSVTEMSGFLNGTELSRNKNIPGFDTLDKSAENNAFGTAGERAVHYSASVAKVLKENVEKYSKLEGFKAEYDYATEANRTDIVEQTYLMNATHIMFHAAQGTQETDIAPNWRIRSGTADQHTSFSVAYNMSLAARQNNVDVDYSMVWDMPHDEQEGTSTGTFVQWVHSICK